MCTGVCTPPVTKQMHRGGADRGKCLSAGGLPVSDPTPLARGVVRFVRVARAWVSASVGFRATLARETEWGVLAGFGASRPVRVGGFWRFLTMPRARLDPFDSFARRSRTCVFVRFRHTPRARGPLGFVGCLARVNRPICPTVARGGCRIRRGSFGFLLVPSTRGTCAALRFLAPPGGPECPAHRPALLQGEPSITFRGSTASRGPVASAQGPRGAASFLRIETVAGSRRSTFAGVSFSGDWRRSAGVGVVQRELASRIAYRP